MGGIQYTRNLIRAISLLPRSELPDLVLKIGHRNKGNGYEKEFLHYPNVVIDRPKIPSTGVFRKISSLIWKLKRKSSSKSYSSCVKMISDECEVAFPVKGANILGPSKKIYWVPDFQYKNMPQLFSNEERNKRDTLYNEMFLEEGILVLSSEAVKEDFYTFFPEFASKKVRVLSFSSVFEMSEYDLDPIATCNSYGLPEKFIYVPNQMWQHKGHDYTIMALGKLKVNGIIPPLVLTGNISDYRKGLYGDYIKKLIEKHNLETQVFHLGILPRQEQVQIYRRAALILQPSLFEGWSTVVEDARALGKSILMSDINVHLEQNPFKGFYFKVGDVSDLANKIANIWPNLEPGPSLEEEKQLILSSNERAVNYARKFMSIVREASEDSLHHL